MNAIKRVQHSAFEDAIRLRALQIHLQQNQAKAIEFINYMVKKFTSHIKSIRTDRGHRLQAKFHWNTGGKC
jgi:hypothetical protein